MAELLADCHLPMPAVELSWRRGAPDCTGIDSVAEMSRACLALFCKARPLWLSPWGSCRFPFFWYVEELDLWF
jgi:hypothetical protein